MPAMETLPGLVEIQKKLEQQRQDLRAERRKAFKTAAWIGAASAAGLLTALALGNPAWTAVVLIIAGIGLLGALVYAGVRASSLSENYASAYKRDINNAIVKHFSQDLAYDESDGIGSGAFVASRLFTTSPDRYKTSDLVSGAYGKTKLRFARIHAEQRHVKRTKKGTRTYYTTIFNGIMLIADFNKHFRGRTYVRTDVAEKFMGNFGRVFQKASVSLSSDQLVQLEDPEFEKEFAVYASDQVEARYILSPALMKRMLELKRRCGTETQFSFCDSSIVIAIANSTDLFTPDFSRPATDTAQLREIQSRIGFFLGIIDALDLNTRIWSKE